MGVRFPSDLLFAAPLLWHWIRQDSQLPRTGLMRNCCVHFCRYARPAEMVKRLSYATRKDRIRLEFLNSLD
jgi:hypothetical protein